MFDILGHAKELMSKCVGCGKCSEVCQASKFCDLDPKSVMQGIQTDVMNCILCGNCSDVCEFTDPHMAMRDLKALAKDAHVPQRYHDTGYVMPIEDHPCRDFDDVWDGDDVGIIPGCVVKCKAPFLE